MIGMELLQPYIDGIVQGLIALLVTFILTVLAMLRGHMKTWLNARTTANQREILHRLAEEAAALAEVTYKDAGGPAKLDAAFEYVIDRANEAGIPLNKLSVRAAIEKAVLDYNAKVKGDKVQ